MTDGLSISDRQFEKLPQKEQLYVLYQNTEELKSMVAGYKFQQKVQWAAIVFIAILGGVVQYFKLI